MLSNVVDHLKETREGAFPALAAVVRIVLSLVFVVDIDPPAVARIVLYLLFVVDIAAPAPILAAFRLDAVGAAPTVGEELQAVRAVRSDPKPALVTAVHTAGVVAATAGAVAAILVAFHETVAAVAAVAVAAVAVAAVAVAAAVDVPGFPTALEAIVQTECFHGT